MTVHSILFRIAFALVVLRGSLDSVASFQFAGLNPAGWLGLLVIAVGGFYCVLTLWNANPVRSTISPESSRRSRLAAVRMPEWIVLIGMSGLLLWVVVPLAVASPGWKWAAREWIRLAAVAVVFLMVFRGSLQGESDCVLRYLPWAMLIPALAGFYQLLMGTGMEIKKIHRIYGTFSHPNPFGFHLVLMALVAWLGWKTKGNSWLWLTVMLSQLVLLFATAGFTAVLMAVAAAGVIIVLSILKQVTPDKRKKFWSVLALSGVILCIGVGVLMKDRIAYEFRPEEIQRAFATGQMKSSFTWRLVAWWKYLQASLEQPWFGHGLGASPYFGPWLMPDGTPAQPHNDLVRWIFELGAVGTVWMMGLVCSLIASLWRIWPNVSNANDITLLTIAWAMVAAAMVGALNDNLFIATAFLMEWAALWAIALAAGVRYKEAKPCVS